MKVEWAVTIEGSNLTALFDEAEEAWKEFAGDLPLNVSPIVIDVTETLIEGTSTIVLYRAQAHRTADDDHR